MRKQIFMKTANPGRPWGQHLTLLARRGFATLSILTMATATVSCGSDGDDNPTGGGGNPVSVSGYVLKGAVQAADVRVRTITANGDVGSVIAGPFTTDASGRWSGEVPGGTTGFHVVTATGGWYIDESTDQTVNLTSEMLGVIQVGQGSVGNVTPITHAIFRNGAYRIQLGASIGSAFNGAIGDMTTELGFDPTTVVPGTNGSSPSTAAAVDLDLYNAILAGFSALLDSNPSLSPAFDNAETWEIVRAVALDMTDGRLDGIDIFGNGILVDDGNGTFLPFPPLDADDISNLVDAATAWAAINLPNVTIPPIDLTSFGNPIITPGGDWDVTGTLTVTGSDAGAFGTTFTPTGVMESVGGVKVDGFQFFQTDISYYVAIGFDETTPAGTVNIVTAGKADNVWITMLQGPPPVPGVTISLTAPYAVKFTDVLMIELASQNTLILNGTLTVTQR